MLKWFMSFSVFLVNPARAGPFATQHEHATGLSEANDSRNSIMRAGGPLKLIEPEEIPPYVWPLASSTSAKL